MINIPLYIFSYAYVILEGEFTEVCTNMIIEGSKESYTNQFMLLFKRTTCMSMHITRVIAVRSNNK